MKNLPPLLLAGLLACGFIACTSADVMANGLSIALTQIERTGDGAVHVTWRVGNPNIVSYLLTKGAHKLTLNGTLVGTVIDNSRLGVPAQNQVESSGLLVPVGPGSASIIDQAVAQGSASYKLESIVTMLVVNETFEKFPLSASGSVPVVAK
jgi:hypothetical protein